MCKRYGVERLDLFGSAGSARNEFDSDSSDLDFVVSFERCDPPALFDRYFGHKEDLERVFGRGERSSPFARGASVRLIGVLELLGAAGIVGPGATGVLPGLTPLAAGSLAMDMVGGFATHVRCGEFLRSGSNLVLFALAAFIARGRVSSS